jgi:hypothetical protein
MSTLKEKFIKESLDIRYQVLEPEKFEQIADDYAIEFAEWSVARAMGFVTFKLNDNELEIFKKEKGL